MLFSGQDIEGEIEVPDYRLRILTERPGGCRNHSKAIHEYDFSANNDQAAKHHSGEIVIKKRKELKTKRHKGRVLGFTISRFIFIGVAR